MRNISSNNIYFVHGFDIIIGFLLFYQSSKSELIGAKKFEVQLEDFTICIA